jgi:rfaE bifunctional protein kinase chain/domain/rfaE bifunctional protein nucleotidyltransferase chain/domain
MGDVLLDRRWEGTAERLCREGPVPVLDVNHTLDAPGGAGNTAMNLASLGARVRLIGVAGDDEPGDALVRRLSEVGIDTEGLVRLSGHTTAVKARMVADGQLLLRSDFCRMADDDEARLVAERALAALEEADAVVLCDYGLGALSALDHAAVRRGARALVVDARRFGPWADVEADVVTPNASEAAELLGAAAPHGDRFAWATEHAEEISRATGARHTLVTLDRDGTVVIDHGRPGHMTHARPAPEQNAVGAGDTFVAGLTLGLAAGLPIDEAADVGQAAADVVVQSPGTSICSADQLLRELGGERPAAASPSASAVSTWEEARAAVAAARRAGRAIVLTNGVFDELHRGHTAFLEEAARLGGLLVVGINSDESVRRLRGTSPVVGEEDRAAVVAALGSVGCAVVFDSETAVPLIRELRPDIYVKGGDYLPGMLAEQSAVHEVGGRLEMLGYVQRHTHTVRLDSPTAESGAAESRAADSGRLS